MEYTDEDFERDIHKDSLDTFTDEYRMNQMWAGNATSSNENDWTLPVTIPEAGRIIADRNRLKARASNRHICGLQGFGALGDVCPECERDALKVEVERLTRENIALQSERSMLTLQLAGAQAPVIYTYTTSTTNDPLSRLAAAEKVCEAAGNLIVDDALNTRPTKAEQGLLDAYAEWEESKSVLDTA